MFTRREEENQYAMLRKIKERDYIHVIIYIWKIFVALTCSMATFYEFEQWKKNEMAREQRGSCIYILFTMEQQEKKRDKQETDYNKILVGAHTRDRIQTKEEMIRKFET